MSDSSARPESLLPYALWTEEALRAVVRDALEHTAKHGLPGDHHFYVTFRTDHPGVSIPGDLARPLPAGNDRRPSAQISWDLAVDRDAGTFSVGLSFGGVPATLTVPFRAMTAFADPRCPLRPALPRGPRPKRRPRPRPRHRRPKPPRPARSSAWISSAGGRRATDQPAAGRGCGWLGPAPGVSPRSADCAAGGTRGAPARRPARDPTSRRRLPRSRPRPASRFPYSPMFPLAEDGTPWRKLPIDGVSTIQVEGRTVLKVTPAALEQLAFQACKDVSPRCGRRSLAQLAKILKDPEASANDRFVALDLLKNANIAAGGVLPMCQDTGTAIVMGKKGQRVWTGGGDE